jgi:hypothetical protein
MMMMLTTSSRPSAPKPCGDLTTTKEFDLWLDGETVEALKLQRPLPDEMLDLVARGEKEDPAPVRDDHLAAHARR